MANFVAVIPSQRRHLMYSRHLKYETVEDVEGGSKNYKKGCFSLSNSSSQQHKIQSIIAYKDLQDPIHTHSESTQTTPTLINMKFYTLTVLFALVFAVQAEVNSWYVSSKDITCTGDANGQINCIPGHTEGVEEVTTAPH